MPSKAIICLSAVLALLPISVHADFKVFCGERCVGADAGGCGVACQFMNNPASCDDVNDSIVFHTEKDVSGCGGVRCKGCDQSKPSKEWDIEELEINDTQECTPSSKNWDGLGEDVDPHFSKSRLSSYSKWWLRVLVLLTVFASQRFITMMAS
ncbi:hypothetical protein CC79DRAFT_1338541 [Sarocladium strictum]